MVKINDLIDGYHKFYDQYFINKPEIYQKLVDDGQSPKTLIIACSDSRVDPSTILTTKPGDIFVVRNVANLVPPMENDMGHHGVSAAIEYAVKTLEVENIIILGHSHCGGIKALVDMKDNSHSFITEWINIADAAKSRALDASTNHDDVCELCEKEAIKDSVSNLLSFPFVKKAVDEGKLDLHGWYFCMETGKIEIVR